MALILDGTSPTCALSMYRDLLTSFVGGTRYTLGPNIDSLRDQSGNARHFVQVLAPSSQPILATAGPNSRACADFDGVDDYLRSTSFIPSDFISASSGYAVVSFIADAITASAANLYNNNAIFADGGGYMGLFMKSPNLVGSYNWDGNEDSTTTTITTGTPYVVEWRHDAGNLYVRVNGGTETSLASGATSNLSTVMYIGFGVGTGAYGNIKLFELATYSTVPSLATRNAIVADFMAQQAAPTSAYVTQSALEQFASTNPPAQVTQITIEQWATTATISGQAMVTQVALEQWVPSPKLTVDLVGNLGGVSQYGRLKYGLKHYSRIDAFVPLFAADITVVAALNLAGGLAPTIVLAADLDVHVNLIELSGDIVPQIALEGSLSLDLPLTALEGSFGFEMVYGASSFISGPLWADAEPCPPPLWGPSEPCPPPVWMTAPPCEPVVWKKTELCRG